MATRITLGTSYIIHFFAILHALVAFICLSAGISDQLILTLLTILLTIIICTRQNAGIEFIASCIILVNVAGFLLGTAGAKAVSGIISNTGLSHALSSLITTEIMGWSILLIGKVAIKPKEDHTEKFKLKSRITWFLTVILVILTIRIIYIAIFQSSPFSYTTPYEILQEFFSNPVVFLIMVCLDIIFVRYMRDHSASRSMALKITEAILFLSGITLLSAFLAAMGIPFSFKKLTEDFFLQLSAISSIVEITTFAVIYLVDYALSYRAQVFQEREKASQARYRYMTLKQQLDPHFLFNSLNILDCLVREEKTEQASTYIHKLAGIYRYMIRNEDEDAVELREEMKFVDMYVDLLKVRFPEGFHVETMIAEEDMSRKVVPCAIQLLIENAIKHNSVSEDSPLYVRIESSRQKIVVTNNIQPRVTESRNSTKLGLKYIDQQYRNLSGTPIEITHNDSIHSVELPLIPTEATSE